MPISYSNLGFPHKVEHSISGIDKLKPNQSQTGSKPNNQEPTSSQTNPTQDSLSKSSSESN